MKSDRNVISGENIETKYCFVVVYLHVKAALCVCITQVNTQINFYERVIKRPNTLWIYFLHKLGEKMDLSSDFIEESIATTSNFITSNKKNIQYFNYSNPVKHFYDQTTNGVEVLIKRNRKRLTKELIESKELMSLLAKSTQRDLSKEEKKKVKKQLLDICKSIPSLTIFLLPGGGLLLPILIKFIPQLLPSSFNENLED